MLTREEIIAGYRLVLGRAPRQDEIDQAPPSEGWEELGSRLLRLRDEGQDPGRVPRAQSARLYHRIAALRRELAEAREALARASPAAGPLRRNALRLVSVIWWTITLQLPQRWQAWKRERRRRAAAARPAPTANVLDPRPVALIIENRWPQPDRDSGSIDVINLVDALLGFGFAVSFIADHEYQLHSTDRSDLARRGVRCIGEGTLSTEDFLQKEGAGITLCVLRRVYAGGNYLESVIRYCPDARILFDAVDLNFLRVLREAETKGGPAPAAIQKMRARELALVRETDATLVVSSVERNMLRELVPEAYVNEMPLARSPQRGRASFESRGGIGFIGGFAHAPNVDALRWFLEQIWPLVHAALPECEFRIVGAGLPREIEASLPEAASYLGHLPDVTPWFGGLRLTVAPLRYGAGAKGKIASSLAAGVPCITTSIGAEGMRLGDTVLVADAPTEFALAIRRAYLDKGLWSRLSDAGFAYAERDLSLPAWRRRLAEVLETLMVMPRREPQASHPRDNAAA